MVQFGGDDHRGGRPARRTRMLDALGETEHDPDVAFFDDPDQRGRAVAGPRGRARRDRARARPSPTPGRAGRTPRSRSTGSATTCATCARSTRSSATPATSDPACTATSARAACTPGSRSTSTRTEGVAHVPPVPGARGRPGRRRTAARCPASTATARPAASCCRGCSAQEVVGLFERGQGALRPRRPDEPGQGRRTRRRWTSTCGSAATGRRADAEPLFFAYPDDGHSFAQAAQPLRRASASAASTRTTAAR